MLGWTTSSCSS